MVVFERKFVPGLLATFGGYRCYVDREGARTKVVGDGNVEAVLELMFIFCGGATDGGIGAAGGWSRSHWLGGVEVRRG